MISLGVVLLVGESVAFNPRAWPNPGNGDTYYLESASLSATQMTTIAAAVGAWDAGAGQVLRGAAWTTTLVTLSSGQTAGLNNGRDEIYFRNDAWFTARGQGGSLAVWFNRLTDDDIVFNSGFTWCDVARPSNPGCRGTDNPSGFPVAFSLGQVTVHEMGHAIAFGHEDTLISTMNSFYPAGGDVGEFSWSIHEDDMAGMQSVKPDGSTGFNVSVGEFRMSGGRAVINWDDRVPSTPAIEPYVYVKPWAAWNPTAPEDAALVYNGTGSQSVIVHWRVSSDTTCTTSDYLVGSRTTTMSTNTPYIAGPSSWSFSAVPAGDYYLCVMADPFNALSETLETDNIVRSRQAIIKVQN